MSDGVRIPAHKARRVCDALFARWALDAASVLVAGSIRRGCDTVGDIDLVAPAPSPGQQDRLFDAIVADVDNPPAPESVFEASGRAAVRTDPIAHAVRGLKPGFLSCDLVVRAWGSTIKVQIGRHTSRNKGWIILLRTGPAGFGQWFLGRWKHHHGIPVGDARFKASVDGHLVDHHGKVIDVETEEECFRRCGIAWMPPEQRDAFMQSKRRMGGEA